MAGIEQHSDQTVKHILDVAAAGTAAATLLQWLPAVAALFTIIWTGIRIWETETVRRWTGRKQ
jgi:hypothetical protein